MTSRSFKNVCVKIAHCAMQDFARVEEKRYISHETDFTDDDLRRIEGFKIAAFIALEANNGRTWDEVLSCFHSIFPYTRFGFKAQDQIISACRAAGIHFLGR